MELLKEWLGSTITRELKAALQWRLSKPAHIRPEWNNRYEDDGSNLRVKGLKPGVVQLMKVCSSPSVESNGIVLIESSRLAGDHLRTY